MSISVIIPTSGARSPKMLRRTLESLSKETLPDDLIDIIVIENGKKRGVKDICDAFSSLLPVRYFYEVTPNLSNARNAGIKNCTSEFLIFFDDDLRFSGNTLSAYASAFRSSPENCFFGGPLDIDYEEKPNSILIDFFPASVRGYVPSNIGFNITSVSEQMFLGGNHAVPRNLIEKYSGYDLLGASGLNEGCLGEETRLQEKIIKGGGFGVYVPGAKVWHYVPRDSVTFRWLLKRYYRRGVTEGFLLKKSPILVNNLFGFPRYAIFKLLRETLKMLMIWRYFTSRQQYVANVLEIQITRGVLAGYISKRLDF